MPSLKSSTITYSVTVEELKQVLANELNVPLEAIKLSFTQTDTAGYGDRGPHYVTTGVDVTVDNKVVEAARIAKSEWGQLDQ